MAQQTINVGAAPNDGTGDPARTAFTKCNANFSELYASGSGDVFLANNQIFTGQNFFNGANVVIGHSALVTVSGFKLQIVNTQISLSNFAASASGNFFNFQKSRNATPGSHTVVQLNDVIGGVQFTASDGSAFGTAAIVRGAVDGTPAAGGDVPGRLEFLTKPAGSAAVERLRIDSTGLATFAGDTTSANYPSGAWTAWTPTISSSAGTITSSTVDVARYTKAGKTITAYFDVTITNAGTGVGVLQISLPVTAVTGGGGAGSFREMNVAGTSGPIYVTSTESTTLMKLVYYNSTSPVVTNHRLLGLVTYEAA